jgi:hypothetical protein
MTAVIKREDRGWKMENGMRHPKFFAIFNFPSSILV